ncbi:hypothetical protein [Curtobacterium sp. 18060]|uniref:hypothetical protein n=1 Tax=Curtobacterium sp. 18060 TaxID=2681408 RepID=UPI00135679ED|nr:hypothetical protein [Curtobacterium sp. 18060]
MSNPNASQHAKTTLVVAGFILLVAGVAMAVVGFTDTSPFLAAVGFIIAVCGVVAVIVAVSRKPVR